ncbi:MULTISPECIES: LytTR family transcriptional regulator DNA-binding domain-containing protein [unclassified Beijerinckia]|uniref:LytTR family transcriptional regulator DNA-binding domain-containing protein n=1 Tax=unclassified Beijerinckia TaxID=2638183 RepID=UPI000894EDC5|nr:MULTISPECIES: LytTR family transcriptional regulator DNA-binding domain-containing protein [unclassified Beijerinckia]MDH7798034.1 hypothetical protein [Beijerinckia sp. GAS462]SED06673.1 transcriptional regulator, LytTR family [Beijerinckia sp. 28-YEA-48]
MTDRAAPFETLHRDDVAGAVAPEWAFRSAQQLLQQPVDAALSSVLEEVGHLAAADRAWMFEYDEALLRFRNTHEWCRPGILSFLDDLQDAPVTMIAWLQQYLLADCAVMISQVKALPRSARLLQVEMLRQSDQSVLCVPVFHGERLRACIGFDAVRSAHQWSPAEIKGLFQCADLIALARYGVASKPSATGRVDFTPLIYLRRHGGVRGVSTDMIIGLRSARNYTEIWLTDGSSVLDLRPFAIWSALVPAASFLRIHRTTIVNTMHIRDVERPMNGKWLAWMRGMKSPWAVSRSYRQELRTRLGI